MAIWVNKDTKVIVQGLTGKNGSLHAEQCLAYGTKIVGGVTPSKGGSVHLGIPVFNSMQEAVLVTDAKVSIMFVPAAFVLDSAIEAIDSGIKLLIIITEGVPVLDMIKIKYYASLQGVRIIGPNCPGIITPGACKIGIMPGYIHTPGQIGVVSRSGTLTYEAVAQLTALGLGQSTCVGIGGDPVAGTVFIDVLKAFAEDDDTKAVVMIGEIGGNAEELAADYIKHNFNKPVVCYIAGVTAPSGKRMGHAGAIISGGKGTAEDKFLAFDQAGIAYTRSPAEIGQTMFDLLAIKP